MPVNADPWVALNPSITISTNTTSTPPVSAMILLQCLANRANLVPDEEEEVDMDSFCQPGATKPGSTTWKATIPILLTVTDPVTGLIGSWNTLHPLRKTRQTFVFTDRDGVAVSSSNRSATFQAYIPSIPFMDNDRGQSLRFDLELSTIGEPVFSTP